MTLLAPSISVSVGDIVIALERELIEYVSVFGRKW